MAEEGEGWAAGGEEWVGVAEGAGEEEAAAAACRGAAEAAGVGETIKTTETGIIRIKVCSLLVSSYSFHRTCLIHDWMLCDDFLIAVEIE